MEEPERGEQSLEFAQDPIEEEGVGFALHLTLCGVSFPGSWLGPPEPRSATERCLPGVAASTAACLTAKELDGRTDGRTDRQTA